VPKPPKYAPSVHPTAVVAASARIGAGAHVGPYCFVDERVTIGRNAVLHSFVSIYRDARIGDDFFAHSHVVVRERCQIGNRVTLQNGAVVGGDGFGFARQADGRWFKMRQAGVAVVEDDVEIQANACVDRATIGETRVRRGAKVDDLVLVGHACQVGEDTLLCGQVGLAGSTKVGSKCILAGQVGAAGHLEIGDGTVITSQSGVPNDVPAGAVYSGYPAVENKQWLKSVAAANRLPEMQKKVRELEEAVEPVESSYEAFRRRVHPDDIERGDREFREAVREQRFYETEYRAIWPNGEVHWLQARGTFVFDAKGNLVRMFGVTLDFDRVKQAEQHRDHER